MSEFLLSSFLRGAREKLGFSQEAMAEYLKVSPRTYQRIESGESQLSALSFIQILKQIDDNIFFTYMNNLHKKAFPVEIDRKLVKQFLYNNSSHQDTNPKLGGLVAKVNLQNETDDTYPKVGLWEWDFVGESKYWSPEMYDIYGFERDYDFSSSEIMERIHPDDIHGVEKGMENLVVHCVPYLNQHRTQVDGQVQHIVNSYAFLIPHASRHIVVGYSKAFKVD